MATERYIEELSKRGYKLPEIITPTQELLEIKKIIDDNNTSIIIPKQTKLKYTLQKSRDFLDSHFDIRIVPYFHETKIGPIRIEKTGTIHPYGIPIKQIRDEEPFYGCLKEVIYNKEDLITAYYYKAIELAKKTNDLSALSYTHELIHSQLNHVKGIVKNYSNIEFLSIFIETLQASETSEKLLRIHDSERLFELSGIIDEINKYYDKHDDEIEDVLLEGSSYAESTLKAYNLFIRYINSTTEDKKMILKSIQKIFNHELSVEDFLIKLNITFESSKDINSIKKYLTR